MCEIDNARPKIENLQTAEASRGWLGFWRFSDQKNCGDASCLMTKIRTIETNEKFPPKIEKIIENKFEAFSK